MTDEKKKAEEFEGRGSPADDEELLQQIESSQEEITTLNKVSSAYTLSDVENRPSASSVRTSSP